MPGIRERSGRSPPPDVVTVFLVARRRHRVSRFPGVVRSETCLRHRNPGSRGRAAVSTFTGSNCRHTPSPSTPSIPTDSSVARSSVDRDTAATSSPPTWNNELVEARSARAELEGLGLTVRVVRRTRHGEGRKIGTSRCGQASAPPGMPSPGPWSAAPCQGQCQVTTSRGSRPARLQPAGPRRRRVPGCPRASGRRRPPAGRQRGRQRSPARHGAPTAA